MEREIQWRRPENFILQAEWKVDAGSGSIESYAEQRRELGVSEATYPHLNLIPASPLETFAEVKDSVVPELPLICVEDDELEEGFSPGGDATTWQGAKKVTKKRPHAFLSGSPSSLSAWPAAQHLQGPSSFSMNEADPNFVVAAATAYAVIKAKERGVSVDADVLRNPITRNLLAHKGVHFGDFSKKAGEGVDKGAEGVGGNEHGRALGNNTTMAVLAGSKSRVPSGEATNMQAWNLPGHFGNPRSFMAYRAEENFFGHAEVQGSVPVTSGAGVSSSQTLPTRQDAVQDFTLQQGMDRNWNEVYSRVPAERDFLGYANAPKRHQTSTMGPPFAQLGPGGEFSNTTSHGRGEGFAHDRFEGEKMQMQSRFQRPCKFFNTPKGCRRGASCYYVHAAASEQPWTDHFAP